MKFFFDNNISPKLARALRAMDVDVTALREVFPEDIKDVELLLQLKDTGWLLVSGDRKIQRRTLEARALRDCGVPAVFFKRFWLQSKRWDQFIWIVKYWPKIEQHTRRMEPGTYVEIGHNGKIDPIEL